MSSALQLTSPARVGVIGLNKNSAEIIFSAKRAGHHFTNGDDIWVGAAEWKYGKTNGNGTSGELVSWGEQKKRILKSSRPSINRLTLVAGIQCFMCLLLRTIVN